MATSMSQCCYLLLRCSGIRSLLVHRWINQTITSQINVVPGCTRTGHCLHQSVGYGNKAGDSTQDGQVTIPVDRLTVSYSRSSGPGGQHVNKVSTKAEVRFHIHTAEWIPDDVKQNIILNNKNRINKAGELLVTSEASRNQHRNLGDCIQKISDIIAEASRKPHEPSAEDIALRASRLERRNKERLKQKKIISATKQSRRMDFD